MGPNTDEIRDWRASIRLPTQKVLLEVLLSSETARDQVEFFVHTVFRAGDPTCYLPPGHRILRKPQQYYLLGGGVKNFRESKDGWEYLKTSTFRANEFPPLQQLLQYQPAARLLKIALLRSQDRTTSYDVR
jgi:hypothetical protein